MFKNYSVTGAYFMMRIGILGGTFDPVHFGHLILAQEAWEKLRLEKVMFIPCCLPPHKYRRNITDAEIRLKMVALAIKSNFNFESSALEIERKGRSYSVETLQELSGVFGKSARLFFITGSDSLAELIRWKDFDKIVKLARFVIAQRPHYPLLQKKSSLSKRFSGQIRFVDITPVDISSSQIRRNVKQGKSIQYLVPEEVRQFILKNKLYR